MSLKEEFVTKKILEEKFLIDLETGKIFFKPCKINRKDKWNKQVTTMHLGYPILFLNGKKFFQHRIIFFYAYNFWPNEIDHINRDKTDNSIINLRSVTRSENNKNRNYLIEKRSNKILQSSSTKKVCTPPIKNKNDLISQNILNDRFHIDIIDGKIYRKMKNQTLIELKSINVAGYIRISIFKKTFLAHRIIWFYHYGYWPDIIDHIDGNKLNNSINNLRECNIYENASNRTSKSNTGYKNIKLYRTSYYVYIKSNKELHYIGRFKKLEDAIIARNISLIELHKNFARIEE